MILESSRVRVFFVTLCLAWRERKSFQIRSLFSRLKNVELSLREACKTNLLSRRMLSWKSLKFVKTCNFWNFHRTKSHLLVTSLLEQISETCMIWIFNFASRARCLLLSIKFLLLAAADEMTFWLYSLSPSREEKIEKKAKQRESWVAEKLTVNARRGEFVSCCRVLNKRELNAPRCSLRQPTFPPIVVISFLRLDFVIFMRFPSFALFL